MDHVSIRVAQNTVHALIGPNGAGKTTLFNVIAGVLPPSEGQVIFRKRDITDLKVHERSRLGIGRSYQVVSLFSDLTVRENIRLAVQSRAHIAFRFFREAHCYGLVEEKTDRILHRLSLEDTAYQRASHISHGHQRSLEMGIAIAADPTLLLLDEPTEGLAPMMVQKLMTVIEGIKNEETGILLVEQNLSATRVITDHYHVLEEGRVVFRTACDESGAEETLKSYLRV